MTRHLCLNTCLRVLIVTGVLAGTALPCSAAPPEFNAAVSSFESHESDSYDVASESGRHFLLSGRSMALLLAMGGAAVITRTVDKDQSLRRTVDGSMFDPLVDTGDVFGNGLAAGGAALGLYAAGELFDSGKLSSAGADLSKSLLLTWGSVWTLKLLVDADRPSGGDYAFPSGHTATAFAMAPVLTKHFGWKVGLPVYTLATATAFSRLEEGKHRMADVLVGAALGLVIGSEVTSEGGLRAVREHVAVHGRGLGVKVRF